MTAALVIGPAGTACACSCAEPDPVKNAEWADLVFVGVVVDVDRPVFSTSTADLMTARLTVEQVRKGNAAGHVEVKTAMEGPSCGFDFVEGNRYLIYSREGQTSLCSGNQLLGAAPEVELEGDMPVAVLVGGGAVVLIAAIVLWWVLRRRQSARHGSGPADAGPAEAGPDGQDSA
ncbi:EGFR-like transmembrane domain-containing protein [Catellatospora sichuanensis]|uniref:EGFR-like transmembrane domain-containing protein n=1 Tax=Catellatospora sichuanensis TaxID=1969805 RepID=UPI001184438A|nr:transmembrane domain-containing protein [Catellatospora sichuanensis]